MSLIEKYRAKVVKDIMNMPNMASSWPHFKEHFRRSIRNPLSPNPTEIFLLGDELSAAFRSNPIHSSDAGQTTQAQEQADASAGGSVWEGLVVWYLNLCLAGTRSVAVKKRSHLPVFLRETLKVTISGGISLTEPDVIVMTIDDSVVNQPLEDRKCPISKLQEIFRVILDTNQVFKQRIKIINIQCKTNWNDSIQTPMLWNLLYASARALSSSSSSSSAVLPLLGANTITFGENGNYIKDLGGYGYGFVTVPTNERGVSAYTSESTPVVRARSFTAGHYWGKPSKPNVCKSLKEFFNGNQQLLPAGLNPGEGFVGPSSGVDQKAFDLL